ncbi:MAG: phospholipase D-like domain-containing protein [Wenzhouxiangellaceae bacterium]|nr:phospholipase D-like domain-containing protein [Wenzhouxiangellaceae bacterium]
MPQFQTLTDASLIFAIFHLVLAPTAVLHAMLFKRDSRAAFGWIALCLLLPAAGPVLYALLGVNRIQKRARRLALPRLGVGFERGRARIPQAEPNADVPARFRELAGIGQQLSGHELAPGNSIEALRNGDRAYPAMLEAIDEARRSVFLISYIFDADAVGQEFIDALVRAKQRGVDVRVVIDGVGQFYSFPPIPRRLRRAGIETALFLPPRLLPPKLSINLRNHHKILAVDGHSAFTGGLNISDRHRLGSSPGRKSVQDLHFRFRGPVAMQLENEFLRTWEFTTGHRQQPPPVSALPHGDCHCRALTDGPDEDLDHITMLLSAMIAQAKQSILIMTPYFLPPREIIGALQAACLRGVEVKLVLPEENNLPYVHWATRNMLWEVLYQGVEVYYQPPPFVHSKLFVVDDRYTLVGSANWDPRSLRLNFELQVEVFSQALAAEMASRIREAAESGREVTLAEVDERKLAVRLRDSLCWLFSPYL